MPQGSTERLVLIVDDDDLVRSLLGRLVLTIPNVKAIMASSAQEAIGVVLSNPIALVITDMNMPGESGAWLLQQLRAKGFNIPVILHSGSIAPEDEPRILQMGVTRFVRKPAPPPLILRTVSELLG